jgi:hypothetical protein
MISMSVVRLALKMEQVFHMGYQKGDKVFYIPPTNWQGEAFVANHIHEWDDHWKVVNASLEKGLNSDENL